MHAPKAMLLPDISYLATASDACKQQKSGLRSGQDSHQLEQLSLMENCPVSAQSI